MKILMVGSGGREHALIKKLLESEKVTSVICAPGNAGIACDAECFNVAATDISGMLALAKEQAVDMVFVAPDDPLALGMVDVLEANGIRAFGPSAKAAEIESSKVFSKNLMKKYGIPTAEYEVFTSSAAALEYINNNNKFPIVIKADGLALGKGVIIAENSAQAEDALKTIMEDKIFGASGNSVVVEEFLTGPEVSVLAFCDGKTLAPMVSSMDHKRALDGDEGLNTGGMGTIAPNPCYTPDIQKECMEKIFLPTVKAMAAEGCPFKGCLYFGLMLTPDGAKVIEYNSRFGDPETQVVLPLLETPLIDVVNAVIDEKLDETQVVFSDEACACVVLASGGYPTAYKKGIEITGLDEKGGVCGATVYHAGTKKVDGHFATNGGRVLGVSARAVNLSSAIEKAYSAAKLIKFDGAHMRTDIGSKALNELNK